MMKTTNTKTIALDFDGVIAHYENGWFDQDKWGEPLDGVKEAIDKLMKIYNVVIFTCRSSDDVRLWLRFHNFPLLKISDRKPGAVQYIDDRGYKFTTWKDYFDNN